jgi:glycosyltransferase involved in cell wall biosynthesis
LLQALKQNFFYLTLGPAIPMPDNIAVSIIIPTYNYGRFLGSAIESIQQQSRRDFELLIMDDGSTDNTKDVVEPYLNDQRITYHALEHRGGRMAFNDGAELARAEIIAQCDADDMWLPEKLAVQLEALQQHPEVGLVYTNTASIDEQGQIIKKRANTNPCHNGKVSLELVRQNFIPGPTTTFRKSLFIQAGGFDPSFEASQDYDLLLRMSAICEFLHIDQTLYLYRRHDAQISTAKLAIQFLSHIRAIENFSTRNSGLIASNEIGLAIAKVKKNLGHYYLKKEHDKKKARKVFREAIAASPFHLSAWNRLLRSYFQSV